MKRQSLAAIFHPFCERTVDFFRLYQQLWGARDVWRWQGERSEVGLHDRRWQCWVQTLCDQEEREELQDVQTFESRVHPWCWCFHLELWHEWSCLFHWNGPERWKRPEQQSRRQVWHWILWCSVPPREVWNQFLSWHLLCRDGHLGGQ